ncbi:MAG: hypothetical protein M1834_007306 [Cirrosporium novae-zelandiae]|nr:MAG: hypothetical protein M1834_007306 [Cirrosporium novae-zelandiae]
MAIKTIPVWIFILRILQAVFAIVVLGLCAYVANIMHEYIPAYEAYYGVTIHSNQPSRTDFMIFDSCWILLALIYLLVTPFAFSASPKAANANK